MKSFFNFKEAVYRTDFGQLAEVTEFSKELV